MIQIKDNLKLQEDTQKAGFSVTSLSKAVGCSKAHISSILNNGRNPSAPIAVKICEQLGGQFENYFFITTVHKKKQTKNQIKRK